MRYPFGAGSCPILDVALMCHYIIIVKVLVLRSWGDFQRTYVHMTYVRVYRTECLLVHDRSGANWLPERL